MGSIHLFLVIYTREHSSSQMPVESNGFQRIFPHVLYEKSSSHIDYLEDHPSE